MAETISKKEKGGVDFPTQKEDFEILLEKIDNESLVEFYEIVALTERIDVPFTKSIIEFKTFTTLLQLTEQYKLNTKLTQDPNYPAEKMLKKEVKQRCDKDITPLL